MDPMDGLIRIPEPFVLCSQEWCCVLTSDITEFFYLTVPEVLTYTAEVILSCVIIKFEIFAVPWMV